MKDKKFAHEVRLDPNDGFSITISGTLKEVFPRLFVLHRKAFRNHMWDKFYSELPPKLKKESHSIDAKRGWLQAFNEYFKAMLEEAQD